MFGRLTCKLERLGTPIDSQSVSTDIDLVSGNEKSASIDTRTMGACGDLKVVGVDQMMTRPKSARCPNQCNFWFGRSQKQESYCTTYRHRQSEIIRGLSCLLVGGRVQRVLHKRTGADWLCFDPTSNRHHRTLLECLNAWQIPPHRNSHPPWLRLSIPFFFYALLLQLLIHSPPLLPTSSLPLFFARRERHQSCRYCIVEREPGQT